MKIAVRALSLSLVIVGLAAGVFSQKTTAGVQVVPPNTPMPICPFDGGDCGLSRF